MARQRWPAAHVKYQPRNTVRDRRPPWDNSFALPQKYEKPPRIFYNKPSDQELILRRLGIPNYQWSATQAIYTQPLLARTCNPVCPYKVSLSKKTSPTNMPAGDEGHVVLATNVSLGETRQKNRRGTTYPMRPEESPYAQRIYSGNVREKKASLRYPARHERRALYENKNTSRRSQQKIFRETAYTRQNEVRNLGAQRIYSGNVREKKCQPASPSKNEFNVLYENKTCQMSQQKLQEKATYAKHDEEEKPIARRARFASDAGGLVDMSDSVPEKPRIKLRRGTAFVPKNSEADMARPKLRWGTTFAPKDPETDVAHPKLRRGTAFVPKGSETDVARPKLRWGTAFVPKGSETDVAHPKLRRGTAFVPKGSETDVAHPLKLRRGTAFVSKGSETDVPRPKLRRGTTLVHEDEIHHAKSSSSDNASVTRVPKAAAPRRNKAGKRDNISAQYVQDAVAYAMQAGGEVPAMFAHLVAGRDRNMVHFNNLCRFSGEGQCCSPDKGTPIAPASVHRLQQRLADIGKELGILVGI